MYFCYCKILAYIKNRWRQLEVFYGFSKFDFLNKTIFETHLPMFKTLIKILDSFEAFIIRKSEPNKIILSLNLYFRISAHYRISYIQRENIVFSTD